MNKERKIEKLKTLIYLGLYKGFKVPNKFITVPGVTGYRQFQIREFRLPNFFDTEIDDIYIEAETYSDGFSLSAYTTFTLDVLYKELTKRDNEI